MAAPVDGSSERPQSGIGTGSDTREQQQAGADRRSFAAGQPVDAVHEVEQIDPPDPEEADRGEVEKVPRLGQDKDADRHCGGLRQQPHDRRKAAQIVDPRDRGQQDNAQGDPDYA